MNNATQNELNKINFACAGELVTVGGEYFTVISNTCESTLLSTKGKFPVHYKLTPNGLAKLAANIPLPGWLRLEVARVLR